MASKRSFEDEQSVTGYLQNVSTITTSGNGKTKYFTGSLQLSKSDVKRVVCFSPEKHTKFVQAANLQSPVKLIGANLSPGRNNAVEIICKKNTELQIVQNQLPFKKVKFDDQTQRQDSQSHHLSALDKENINATVFVKICQLEDQQVVNTKYGKKTIVQSIVADNTAAKKITFWQGLHSQVKVQNFYKITNLVSREYPEGTISLNTTKQTTITEVQPPYENTVETDNFFENQQKEVQVAQVIVTESKRCGNKNCLAQIEIIENSDPTIRCKKCNMKQLVSGLEAVVTTCIHTAENEKFFIQETAMKAILSVENQSSLMQDFDRLEDFLLESKNFIIKYDNTTIVNMERKKQSNE